MESLTPRELQLAKLVAEGFSNQQIADRLRLSRQTVKNHIQAAYRKLEVRNRIDLSLRLTGKTVEDLRRRFVVLPPDSSDSPEAWTIGGIKPAASILKPVVKRTARTSPSSGELSGTKTEIFEGGPNWHTHGP